MQWWDICSFSSVQFSSVQFSSVRFKMVSMRSGKPIYSFHPVFQEFPPMLPLKQFQCWSDWRWSFLVISRKIVERFLFLRISPPCSLNETKKAGGEVSELSQRVSAMMEQALPVAWRSSRWEERWMNCFKEWVQWWNTCSFKIKMSGGLVNE